MPAGNGDGDGGDRCRGSFAFNARDHFDNSAAERGVGARADYVTRIVVILKRNVGFRRVSGERVLIAPAPARPGQRAQITKLVARNNSARA